MMDKHHHAGDKAMHPPYTSLTKCNPERGQFRYYAVSVQKNLFGSWSLVREWGRIGSSSRVRIDLHDSQEDATRFMQRRIQQKKRRGYR